VLFKFDDYAIVTKDGRKAKEKNCIEREREIYFLKPRDC
jgi:hypothetical protein